MADLKSARRTRSLVWLTTVVACVATAYGLWFFFGGPNTSKYAPVIASVGAGQIKENEFGRIDLAKSFPGVTPRDEIFITRRSDGSFVILFPTYYDKGPIIAGLMYTSRPLIDQDTYMQPRGGNLNERRITIARWRRMAINRKIDDHWYQVSYGMG